MLRCRQRSWEPGAWLRRLTDRRAGDPRALRNLHLAVMSAAASTAYGQTAFVDAAHSYAGKCRRKRRDDQEEELQDG